MVRLVIWDGDRSHYEVIVIADKVGIMKTVGFQVMTYYGEYMYMYQSMLIDFVSTNWRMDFNNVQLCPVITRLNTL